MATGLKGYLLVGLLVLGFCLAGFIRGTWFVSGGSAYYRLPH